MVVGDSSPAVDAVVCRSQPLVVMQSESDRLLPSFPLPSSGQVTPSRCHIGLWAASFPGDCPRWLLGSGPSVSSPRPPHLPICLRWLVPECVFHLASWPRASLPFGGLVGARSPGRTGGPWGAGLKQGFPVRFTCDVVETKQGLHLSNSPAVGDMRDSGAPKQSPTVVTCLVQWAAGQDHSRSFRRDLGVFVDRDSAVI